jgi:hypothetical protein
MLYGEKNDPERLGWIEALILNAITNVVRDVSGVISGKVDIKSATLSFFLPNIGNLIGAATWDKKLKQLNAQAVSSMFSTAATTAAATTNDVKMDKTPEQKSAEKDALIKSLIPFTLALANQITKGYRI